ncbi:MAG: hypothetical protein JWN70_213 [Planctomycetaceae bacterium]|nr:hypothetical protein [Planctomycetaceae bacterium]
MHGSGKFDESGEPIGLDDGFLTMLRPYRGLREHNFHVVMQALFVVGERFHSSDVIDRKLVESLWSMCSRTRCWGLDPKGMLRRNNLISEEDIRRLESWIEIFERSTFGLLRGCPPHDEVERYAQYIIDVGPSDNIRYFIPLMQRFLEDPDCSSSDPSVIAEALGRLGASARDVLPALYAANKRTYPSYCDVEAHDTIANAIRLIETDR